MSKRDLGGYPAAQCESSVSEHPATSASQKNLLNAFAQTKQLFFFFFLQLLTFNLVFHQEKKVVIPAMEVSAQAASQMKL